MSNKKELDLDELDKIAGGVLSSDAYDWIVKNINIILKLYKEDPGLYTSIEWYINYMKDADREFTLEEVKELFKRLQLDMSKFKD